MGSLLDLSVFLKGPPFFVRAGAEEEEEEEVVAGREG
jgi:hypothetical protein